MAGGILFDIKHFAIHDGPGIRTTLFLKGCPLRCAWCHNPEGISLRPQLALLERKCQHCGACFSACPQGVHRLEEGVHRLERGQCTLCGACTEACYPGALVLYGKEYTAEACLEEILADRDFYVTSGGGVTFSGGEPLLQADFVAEVMALCHASGVDTALDTCGEVPWEAFEKVLPHTDRVLLDIKHIDGAAHQQWTGRDNRRILENLRRLNRRRIPVEVRIPCVPGVNTEDGVIDRIGRLLAGYDCIQGVRPLAYHDFARTKYAALGLPDTLPRVALPDAETMEAIRCRLAALGLTVFR